MAAKGTWYWDASANRYRASTGAFVSNQKVIGWRDAAVDHAFTKTDKITSSYSGGSMSEAAFNRQMRTTIKAVYGSEYVFGRGGMKNMTDADWKAVGTEVTRQFSYLDKFVSALKELSPAQIAARARMYVSGATQAHSRGLAASWDIDLPVHPGDGGTVCLGNCRCNWDIRREGGETVAYWQTSSDPCPDCSDRAFAYSPFRPYVDKGYPLSDEMVKDMAGGSAEPFLESDGAGGYRFNAERAALHDKIIRDAVEHIPRSADPTFFMLGGGTAAGKSTMLNSGKLSIPELEVKSVLVDPDKIKKLLPEYQQMIAVKDPKAAAFAHEESSYVAKRMEQVAIANRRDLVLDGTGGKPYRVANLAKENGYKSEAAYATVPVSMAIERAQKRGEKEQRFVPADVIISTHVRASQVFDDAVAAFDTVSLFDTTDGAVLVVKAVGGKPTIHDQAAYERFVKIGKPDAVD